MAILIKHLCFTHGKSPSFPLLLSGRVYDVKLVVKQTKNCVENDETSVTIFHGHGIGTGVLQRKRVAIGK
eukprot:m.90677 g.90677  ORF g.90677 m.90677 type:complete len:70 (+) comp13277_c0_seq2:332-541(+)